MHIKIYKYKYKKTDTIVFIWAFILFCGLSSANVLWLSLRYSILVWNKKNKAFYNQNWAINEKLSCINLSGKSNVWPVSFWLWCSHGLTLLIVIEKIYILRKLQAFRKAWPLMHVIFSFFFLPFFLQINFSSCLLRFYTHPGEGQGARPEQTEAQRAKNILIA